jgi:uncharacterized membrane protein YtjA (UPF0391 family)
LQQKPVKILGKILDMASPRVGLTAEPCPVLARSSAGNKIRSASMLHLVITLLIIALIAAVLGFGGIAGAAVGIAKIVFVVALVLFLVSLIAGGVRGSFGRRL